LPALPKRERSFGPTSTSAGYRGCPYTNFGPSIQAHFQDSETAMPCINAVSFCEDPSIESICRRVLASGFDAIEVSRPPFYVGLRTKETRLRFAEWADENALGLQGFDCWVDVLPFDQRDETRAEFCAAIEFAQELQLGSIITHDAWLRDTTGISPQVSQQKHLDLFLPVADLCQEAGLGLLFEPHPDTLSMENSWCIDFIDGLESPNVGILYDCCHYGVGQPDKYLDSIAQLGARIRHLHISDGDCKTYALHLPLGDGKLDVNAIVRSLQAISFDGTLTNDLYSYPLLDDGARRNAKQIVEIERILGIGTQKRPHFIA
jgi:sugar phosphate isomerase/epimerase